MFTVHSVLSGYVNHLARRRKGVVNGLYVSLYYAGGTLGSYLPVVIYEARGWNRCAQRVCWQTALQRSDAEAARFPPSTATEH